MTESQPQTSKAPLCEKDSRMSDRGYAIRAIPNADSGFRSMTSRSHLMTSLNLDIPEYTSGCRSEKPKVVTIQSRSFPTAACVRLDGSNVVSDWLQSRP